jgi:hypothetical protein
MSRGPTQTALGVVICALAACLWVPASQPISSVPLPAGFHVVGVQTHFDALVGIDTLNALKSFGFTIARIDAQASDIRTTLAMIAEAQAAGLRPLVIVRDGDQLERLPDGIDAELKNEPDLNGPAPEMYARLVWEAIEIARRGRQTLWIGAIGNLNRRGLEYLKSLGQLPADVGVTVHRYGDGTFQDPHEGFQSRDAEVAALRAIIGDRPFGVSEFGYPKHRYGWGPFRRQITPEQAAVLLRQEIAFWALKGASWSVIYQLNDGPTDTREDRYGIRAFDGTWRPAAQVLMF